LAVSRPNLFHFSSHFSFRVLVFFFIIC
jgi:hypothetical protein